MRAPIVRIVLAASLAALAGCSALTVDGYQPSSGYVPTYDPYLAELRRQNDLLERQTRLAEREEKAAAREKKQREFSRQRAQELEDFKRKNAGWMKRVECVTARRKAGEKDVWEKCK